jgi:hypothetical protein
MNGKIATYWTRDLNLASVLVSLGFKLRKKDPIVRVIHENGNHSDTFYFQHEADTEDFGRLSGREVFKAWAGEDSQAIAKFKAKHPAAYQVIEYMGAAAENRARLIDCIKTDVKPMVCHEVDGHKCFMPLDASPELKARMQAMIEEVT